MGKYGLACDNLIETEIVTAEGKVVRASTEENADLLWGLRGGGGNFGIVTEFVYQLHLLEPMIGGLILHPLDRTKEVLQFFREVTQTLPDELVLSAAILVAPDGTPVCALAAGYNGDPAEGEKALAPIRKFGQPLADMVTEVPYVQHQSMLDEAYPSGLFHYWKAGFMEAIADEAIDVMTSYFKSRPSPLSHVLIEHMHGAAARVPATDTAFAHRLNQYNFGALTIWPEVQTLTGVEVPCLCYTSDWYEGAESLTPRNWQLGFTVLERVANHASYRVHHELLAGFSDTGMRQPAAGKPPAADRPGRQRQRPVAKQQPERT